ncbi:AraC family transcriptional regulator [Streptomyces sp. CMB-StM0423]|uniref:AraC family transcriptional regulator n=1 Tax=Streptomyces sp. CMB-StM0423 TaxID=2059884 RepID=UPI000C6FE022|nr:AraC family transcriptional regulator [Streptomyces sp. CMB-StM0423]AUH42628.1 AraC family transcriptional regulator [Streptomyces sp. CMB-StM0423]
MIGDEFRSDEVPAPDRFSHWTNRMCSRMEGFCALEPGGERWDGTGFLAEELEIGLGEVQVAARRLSPVNVRRASADADVGDDAYQFLMPLQGSLHTDWDGRTGVCRPGGMYFHDGTRLNGFDCRPPDACGTFDALVVTIPKERLTLPAGSLRRLVGRELPGDQGPGALLAGAVGHVLSSADVYRPTDTARLGTAVLDLVHAHLAHQLEALTPESLDPEHRRHALLVRVVDFMRHHLEDPELTPQSVADAHHVSVSYLHRIFRAHTGGRETVAGWIRRQRLEHARRDLADPVLAAVPVHRIAARWGYIHAAAFTRNFRAAYGVTPREYRHGDPAASADGGS